MRKNIYKNQYGFSLIETLIAVSILMIAIAGPLSLVQAGLFSSIHQRNQVTATYLAQEAIEYIKNLRDTNSYVNHIDGVTNWLAGPGGSALLTTTCAAASGGCYVDPHDKLTGNTYIETVNGTNKYLYQNTNTNGFSYSYDSSGTLSPYKRVVTVTAVTSGTTAGDEATVSVTMTWNDNAITRTYTVSENIFNYAQ